MKTLRTKSGVALITVIIYALLASLIAGVFISMAVNESKLVERETQSTAAFYLAETGVQWALRYLTETNKEGDDALPDSTYTDAITLNDEGTGTSYYGANNIEIQLDPVPSEPLKYFAKVTATINDQSTRTIHATLARYRRYLPTYVFDYVYFINNWGWFYGDTINANGDIRSNGNFSFRYDPSVNGDAYAADTIIGGGAIGGIAGDTNDEGSYPRQHHEVDPLPMPNLKNLDIYEDMAISQDASISVGDTVLVNGVYGDEEGESGNIVLIGTAENPIVVHGPNVIRGDVIIKGVVTGQGTIYSGRNVYIAGNVTYKNSVPVPDIDYEHDTQEEIDQKIDDWYEENKSDDLVAYAARESIFWGDYTNTTSWKSNCYDDYLKYWGNEDAGVDGIPGTDDEYEDDGTWQEEYEDIDGDGEQDGNYTWSYVATEVPITDFDNLPEGVDSFNDIATNDIQRIDGIFYTNHAISGRCNSLTLFGAVIGKDEAIIFNNYLHLYYDWRVHSRFTKNDPNQLVNIGLPMIDEWGIEKWDE